MKSEHQMSDLEFLKHAAERGIEGIIEDRTARGKRLAGRYSNLPQGLTWEQFLKHPEVADLGLDFITASEMYDAYKIRPTRS